MKIFRKIVDERQERELMRIESIGFHVVIAVLTVSIVVQLFILNTGVYHVIGETVALVIGALWSMMAGVRRGLWDYFSKPGIKTYISYSLIVSFITSIIMTLPGLWVEASFGELAHFFVTRFLGLSVFGFLVFSFYGTLSKMRMKKLQQEYADEDE